MAELPVADRGLLPTQQSTAEIFVIAAISVAALYAGSALFIPLALAILLAFTLTPALVFLRRRGVPKVVATIAVVVMLLGTVAAIGTVITSQVTMLVEDLPKYEQTLREKITSLKSAGLAGGTMDRATETLKNLQNELDEKPAADKALPKPSPVLQQRTDGDVVPVEIRQSAKTPVEQVTSVLQALVAPFATIGVVVLFLIFILLEREDFRDRLIRLLGTEDMEKSTTALNETAGRLSKYLFTLTMLNASFGVVIGCGLWMIGVPSPALWGLVAALMRFVPFVGSIIAAALPLILAAAVDPGWSMFVMTLVLFLVTEPIMGQVIEPVVQGRVTGLSTLAILVSTAFWTLLWGPIGLLLALPLTLVLVSVGRHLQPFSFFNFLLGDQPALSPTEKFYQRILSGDADDAVMHATEYLKDMEPAEYYDSVVRPALATAALDADRNRFSNTRINEIADSVKEVVSLLDLDPDDAGPESSVPTKALPTVVCLGARTVIDDTGALILASLLSARGIQTEVVTPGNWRRITELEPQIICVGSFSSRYRLQYAMRYASRARPSAHIVGGWWAAVPADESTADKGTGNKNANIATSFGAVADACVEILLPGNVQRDEVAA